MSRVSTARRRRARARARVSLHTSALTARRAITAHPLCSDDSEESKAAATKLAAAEAKAIEEAKALSISNEVRARPRAS